MKVEFETENVSPTSRHSHRNTSNRCSPYPDSNFSILIRAAEYFRPNQEFNNVEGVSKNETDLKKGQRLLRKSKMAEKIENIVSGGSRAKSLSLTSAAECFLPLQVIIGDKLVSKHEKWLEKGQRLPRKVRNNVTHGKQVQS